MTLNTTGKRIQRQIIKYLKEINEYHKVEEGILIESTAMAYQMYDKYLNEAENLMQDPDSQILGLKFHALSHKFYVNYTANLKTLGISAIQRKKLDFTPEEEPTEGSIFDKIDAARRG
jgi:hypothetical protein